MDGYVFPYGASPFIFIFYECSSSQGAWLPWSRASIFLSIMCLRQSLCFWSVITVIYSCGFLLKGFPLSLSQSGISGSFAATIWCFSFFVATDYRHWPFYFTWSRICSVSITLINEDSMFFTLRDGGGLSPCNCKPHIFHNIFKSQKWVRFSFDIMCLWHETRMVWLFELSMFLFGE